MLIQFLTSLFNSIINTIVTAFQWSHFKFYFIAVLLFLFSVGFVYRDIVTMGIQNIVFNQIRFRECRDLIGLQDKCEAMVKKSKIVQSYAIYLYQPINNAFYKKIILTNSKDIMKSPALQGIYLKDQPTINRELTQHDFYLVDPVEVSKHTDLQYLIDINPNPCLFYSLKVDNKVIGEVMIRFDHKPTILEIEDVMKDISPLLYNYIL
jgi:hypothetical protein